MPPMRRRRVGGDGAQQRSEAPASARDRRRSNRSAAYSSCRRARAVRRRRRGARRSRTSRSNLAVPVPTGERLEPARPGSVEAAVPRLFCSVEHDLEQRVAGEGPGRVEHLDQPLEGQVLVGVGGEVGVADPGEELGEGRVAGGVGAQHQRVDEEADQVVERRRRSGRRRGADRDVGAGAEPGEQHGEAGLQHHEEAGAAGRGRAAAARACSSASRSSAERVAAVAGHGRAGPVGGQGELLGQAGERPRQYASCRATGCPGRPRRRAARAATACSRRTAPAAAPSRARGPGGRAA